MKEFIVLMAALTALVALSIDAMLPALSIMAQDLNVTSANNIQYVVGFIFIGMTIGQVIYGPLSDSIGRKPTLYIGCALYVLGSLISWSALNLPIMLVGRFIQGLGVAGPRILTMAIVRDKFHGRKMAQVMSLIMGTFIMVPAVAPAIGQVIMHTAGWRSIFLFYIAFTAGCVIWSHFRLEETLPKEKRKRFNLAVIWAGLKEAANTRPTLGYTITSGLVFGSLLSYLNSAQQVFQDIFHAGDKFALYFGMLALAIGASFFTNSALVQRYGMRRITSSALCVTIAASVTYVAYLLTGHSSLWGFMSFAGVTFFCLGLTFGNMGAMALEPMGHIAGLAAALMGAVSTAISITIGIIVGQLYDQTLLPLAMSFLCLGVAGFAVIMWTEGGFKVAFQPHEDQPETS